jgi:hypothetical protein
MWGALWREDGSVVYNCCWPSPKQSFSGPSPMGLVTIFYCLRIETSLFVASYDSQSYGGGIRTRLHTGYCRISESTAFYNFTRTEYRTPNSRVPLFISVVTVFFQSVALDMGFQQFKQNHSNCAFSKLLPSNGRLFLLDYSGFQPPRHNILYLVYADCTSLRRLSGLLYWLQH